MKIHVVCLMHPNYMVFNPIYYIAVLKIEGNIWNLFYGSVRKKKLHLY